MLKNVPHNKLYKGHKIVKVSETNEDNEVFSAAKVRERFKGVLKRDNDLETKITETIGDI